MSAKRSTAAGRAHMARVAALPCCVCGFWPVEVHHVKEGRYSQSRASDFDTIPLCARHHRTGGHGVAIEAGARTWRERFGSEIEMLARVRAMLGDE